VVNQSEWEAVGQNESIVTKDEQTEKSRPTGLLSLRLAMWSAYF
jgi:hypothetical protein